MLLQAVIVCCSTTLIIFLAFVLLRSHIPWLFTQDTEVAGIITSTLPLVGFMHFVDGVAQVAHGLLRGIGRQKIGGPVNLIAYYAVSIPLSIVFGFPLDWKLEGLWLGATIGLVR